MNRFTTGIITALRYLFLLLSVAGALALTFYIGRTLVAPPQPGEVVTLGVRQFSPAMAMDPLGGATPNERAVAAGQPATYVPRGSTGGLVYRETNPAVRLLLRLMTTRPQPVPYVLASLLFCVLVYQILRDIRPGIPFTPANVRRLRWLGVLLIGCDVYTWTTNFWLSHYLATVVPAGVVGLRPAAQFGASLVSNWLIGLMLLIIAAGYQRGVELTEDAELTI